MCPGLTAYQLGWNLVGAPEGFILGYIDGPLYTLAAGQAEYTAVAVGTPLKATVGYWAHIIDIRDQLIPQVAEDTYTITLPAGQFVMVGNPFDLSANIIGADIVYTYNSGEPNPYIEETLLRAGQGAWVYSVSGGTVTISDKAFLPQR